MNEPGQSASDFSEALATRNKLLAALLQTRAAQTGSVILVRCDDEAALLIVEGRVQVLVLTVSPPSEMTLDERLRKITDAQPAGLLHVVVVGASHAAGETMRRVLADAHEPSSLGMHLVATPQDVTLVAGRKLSLLAEASRLLPTIAPLTDEQIASRAQALVQSHNEAASFSATVQKRLPVVSVAIAAVNTVVFFLQSQQVDAALSQAGANMGALVTQGQWWRLMSAPFLHGGLPHLAMNMLVLYFVGAFIERVIGRHRFLLIYLLAALAGSLATAVLVPEVASVGASGALWGVMTTGFGLSLWPRGALPDVMAARLKRGLLTPLLLNMGLSFLPGIDYRAHFAGGAVGLLFAALGLAGNAGGDGKGEPDAAPPTPFVVKMSAAVLTFAAALSLLTAWSYAQHLRG